MLPVADGTGRKPVLPVSHGTGWKPVLVAGRGMDRTMITVSLSLAVAPRTRLLAAFGALAAVAALALAAGGVRSTM